MRRPKGNTRVDPFEVTLCAVFGVSVAMQFFVGPPPGSMSATLPPGFRVFWLILMLIGCVTTLIGVYTPRLWGYLVEQIGLMALGGSLTAYGVQILLIQIQHHTLAPATALGGPLIIGLGVAFLWRRQQIQRDLRALRALTRENP